MGLFDGLVKKIKYGKTNPVPEGDGPHYEYCTKCDANLTLQKGYRNDLPYWVCKGCGTMLLSPAVPGTTAWICDGCGAFLNDQEGFAEDCGTFFCTKCGYANAIDRSQVYVSEDEFQAEAKNPYKGLSDEEMLKLSLYDEEGPLNGHENILLVRDRETGRPYVKKLLKTYDKSEYLYLMEHPVAQMPRIYECFESDNCLIVIEEFIEGQTLLERLNEQTFAPEQAAEILLEICRIVLALHSLPQPIIHRDLKPSNVILSPDGGVYLLDMNAAKWYKEEETEDTKLLGTQYFAAPEQLGYGFAASDAKTDIYALGVLLNMLVTGAIPKEKKAPEQLWSIIETCISLDPAGRPTDEELMAKLADIQG